MAIGLLGRLGRAAVGLFDHVAVAVPIGSCLALGDYNIVWIAYGSRRRRESSGFLQGKRRTKQVAFVKVFGKLGNAALAWRAARRGGGFGSGGRVGVGVGAIEGSQRVLAPARDTTSWRLYHALVWFLLPVAKEYESAIYLIL